MVTVQIMEDNEWRIYSRHNNKDFAMINAETIHSTRGCAVRVIEAGKIIHSAGEKEK